MRSTNIILFLVLLNVAAGVTTAVAPVPVGIATGGDGTIAGASGSLRIRRSTSPAPTRSPAAS
jgi:hypothetical protein